MADPTADAERLAGGYSGRLFLVVTAGFFVVTMGRRLLPPLLPEIVGGLGISTFGAGLALSTFTVVRAGAQYPGGRYADGLSRSTVLLASFLLAAGGFSVLAATRDYPTLLAGVATIGAASGLFVPASRALLSDLFEEKRGRAFGLNMSASDVTGVVAAGVAVAAVELAGWEAAFLAVVAPVALFLSAFAWTTREPLRLGRPGLDLAGTARRLFGRPRFRTVVAAYSLRSTATAGVTNFLPVFLIATQGFSFGAASGVYALRFVVGVVAKPLSGTLGDRSSRPAIAVASLLVTGAGVGALALAPSRPVAVVGVVVYALGQKSFSAPMQAYLMDGFPDASMGGDLGATRTAYMGVGSVGPALVGFLAGTAGFRAAYAGTVLLLAAAALAVLRVEATG